MRPSRDRAGRRSNPSRWYRRPGRGLPSRTSSVSLQAPRSRAMASTSANIATAMPRPRWPAATTTSCTLTSGRQAKVEKPSMALTRPTGVTPSNASTLKTKGRAASWPIRLARAKSRERFAAARRVARVGVQQVDQRGGVCRVVVAGADNFNHRCRCASTGRPRGYAWSARRWKCGRPRFRPPRARCPA